jgi:hypothetical protein
MRSRTDAIHTRDGYNIRVGGTLLGSGDAIPLGSIQKDKDQPRQVQLEWDVLAKMVHVGVGSCYTLEITAIGNRISTSINGVMVAEYVDPATPFLIGKIGLFCQRREAIRFQEISILELPAEPAQESLPPRGAGTADR